jgi:hypothetical protein
MPPVAQQEALFRVSQAINVYSGLLLLSFPSGQVIEESCHGDIARGCDEIDGQRQPAVDEEHESSQQYGEQIKGSGNSGPDAR